MDKHISAFYIQEKMWPIEQMIKKVNDTVNGTGDSANLADQIPPAQRNEIAFAFAVIAKELGVKIPEV